MTEQKREPLWFLIVVLIQSIAVVYWLVSEIVLYFYLNKYW